MQSVTNSTLQAPTHLPVVYPSGKPILTRREVEVLHLMADGLTTKVIGERLGVTFKTAACHRGRILQKLGVDSTVAAVRWAIRTGIVRP
jgi:two-component system, NarL family, response regulator NreC